MEKYNYPFRRMKGSPNLKSVMAEKGLDPEKVTMVVEPGAFRTNFYRPSNLLGSEKKIADYADTAWKRTPESVAEKKDQANDPDKGGELIVDMVNNNTYPSRLIMGFDGVRVVETTLISWLTELNRFREVSARTAYDINDVMKSPLPL